MRRMSEHEDDQFLEKGMITEELVNSIDYDVWVGENQDDVLILAYKTPFQASPNALSANTRPSNLFTAKH